MAAYSATGLEGATGSVITSFSNSFDIDKMGASVSALNELIASYQNETTSVGEDILNTIGPDGDGLKGDYGNSLVDLYTQLFDNFNGFAQFYDQISTAAVVVDATETEHAETSAHVYKSASAGQPEDGPTRKPGKNRFNNIVEAEIQ